MHTTLIAAAHHAGHGIPHGVSSVIVALAAAAVVVVVLKVIARILSPKKRASRSSSPYASTRK
jgi:hypothetical protein